MADDGLGDEGTGGVGLVFSRQAVGDDHIRAGEPDPGGQLQLQTIRAGGPELLLLSTAAGMVLTMH